MQYIVYSRSLLVTYFVHSSVYVLVPNSAFISSPRSPFFGNLQFAFSICKNVSKLWEMEYRGAWCVSRGREESDVA